MSRPNVDEVLHNLSIRFNKIFSDRDFVCCVIEDFQTILENKDKICVLIFPTLGPIYLKALRYLAKIFDLAVFNITSVSGKFKSIAVCHKHHLKKPKEETMLESSKRKRPERQLYVPPAQRASRLLTKQCDKKATPEHDCQQKNKESSDRCSNCSVFNLSDVLNLFYFFNSLPCEFRSPSKFCSQHQNCEFRKFLNFKKFDASLRYDHFIKIYDNFLLLHNVVWKLDQIKCSDVTAQFKSYPFYEFDNPQDIAERPSAVLINADVSDLDRSVHELHYFENSFYRLECDKVCDELENCFMLDLSVSDLGHFFIISIDGSEYFHECQEKHDATDCYQNVKQQLEVYKKVEKLDISAINEENVIQTKESKIPEKNGLNEIQKNNKDIVKNQKNTNKKKASDNKHEQEKEIMRMTKEYINRKTRPIMKYVDDSNDTLRIDKNDSVNNWEDLFDDKGEIQEDLLTEIVDKVGNDITIVKAGEDYTAYTNKPLEDLEHVVELYNFPASLETHDLVQAFSDINSDAMYIKWVDDTHALLVLGSLSQAQKAMNMRNPLIKVRPMTAASAISMDVANKSDLKPAMKRPPTNLQTARRLITSHLGTKSKITKEQMAKEKQDLKNAREMKRLLKQNEKDAWEGNLRSSVN